MVGFCYTREKIMFKYLFLFLLVPVLLWANDTLYVARLKPPDRTILAVFPPGFVLTESTIETRVNVAYKMFTSERRVEKLDSKTGKIRIVDSAVKTVGVLDTMALKVRIYGMDTTRCEIRWTTEYDSIPADINSGRWILTAEGKIQRKKQAEP